MQKIICESRVIIGPDMNYKRVHIRNGVVRVSIDSIKYWLLKIINTFKFRCGTCSGFQKLKQAMITYDDVIPILVLSGIIKLRIY